MEGEPDEGILITRCRSHRLALDLFALAAPVSCVTVRDAALREPAEPSSSRTPSAILRRHRGRLRLLLSL
jgi:hypothetical protein